MKLLTLCKDGGYESTVWSYFLVEIKWLFSIALLRFEDGSREAYHSHAFDCVSWVLRGDLVEECLNESNGLTWHNWYRPSWRPVVTRRSTFHKVTSYGRTWVITFRGPWADTWREYLPDEDRFVTLTHGREEIV